jgi:hypothetical protein
MIVDSEIVSTLLRTLNSCGGIPLREDFVFTQYNVTAMTVQTMAALREHLEHCRSKGWCDYLVDEVDRARKWFILEAGKVLLARR